MKIEGQFLPTEILQAAVDQLRKLPFADVADILTAIGQEHKPVTIEIPDPVQIVAAEEVKLPDVVLESPVVAE